MSPKPKSEKTGPQPHKAPTVEGCCFTVLSSSVQPCWLPCLSVPLRGSWASCPDPRKRGKPACGTNLCRQTNATREQAMHVSSRALRYFSLENSQDWLALARKEKHQDSCGCEDPDRQGQWPRGALELLIHLGLLLLPLFRIQWTTQGLSLGDPNVQTHLMLSIVRTRHSRVLLPSSMPHSELWALDLCQGGETPLQARSHLPPGSSGERAVWEGQDGWVAL